MNDYWIPKLSDFLEIIKSRNPLKSNNGLLQYVNQITMGTMEFFISSPKHLKEISAFMDAMMTSWQDSMKYKFTL